MCGIIGFISHSPTPAVDGYLELLSHRGPDAAGKESGCCTNRNGGTTYYSLGHRRLSIIDLVTGDQPLVKKAHVMLFNGEIYNYIEVAAELSAKHGVQFVTKSDTEVLLEAYLTWGPDCLTRLNGMWAFAVLNLQNGDLFCARDRFGEKPFYYISKPGNFVFSSEVGPLLRLIDRPSANLDVVTSFLVGVSPKLDQTFYRDIAQLAPASRLRLPADTLEPAVSRYWSVTRDVGGVQIGYEDACAQVRALVEDSVRLRMRSDVEVGVAASGGMDSSIVLGNATSSGGRLRSVSVIYDGEFQHNETHFIKKLATVFPVAPEYTTVKADLTLDQFLELGRTTVRILGMPSPYTSVPYVNELYTATRDRGIKVLLEGQGADEVFGGYTFFRAFQAFALATGKCSVSDFLISCRFRGSPWKELYMLTNTLAPLLDRTLLGRVHVQERIPDVNGALREAQQHMILPHLLDYGDRLSMRRGVEVRLPFLDHRLVEFVNALPAAYKVCARTTKRILRDSFRHLLPTWILTRSKVGFGNPTDAIIARHLDLLTREFVLNGELVKRGIVHLKRNRVLGALSWRRFPNYQRLVWRLLTVELWQREWSVSI